MDLNEVVAILGLLLAVASILLFIIDEFVRRPRIEFLSYKDEPTADAADGYMWRHLKVRNKMPIMGFNRDAALECVARVSFLDPQTRKPLASQITAHWTSQPEPRDYASGRFDPSKIPTCQHMDIGFRGEMFDVLIKYNGQKGFMVADPWVVYKNPIPPNEARRLWVDADECVARVEIEAINLGKTHTAEYTIKDKGLKAEGVQILRRR